MTMAGEAEAFQTVAWVGDAARGSLRLIDQTLLPTEFVEIDCHDTATVWEAIKRLRVRGAPAIGVAAAYGAVIGARSQGLADGATVRRALSEATAYSANQPAHGREPVLGARPDGCDSGGRSAAIPAPGVRCWTGC